LCRCSAPGGCLYLVDADGTAIRTVPEDADLADLAERYGAFLAARGNDLSAGLRLGERLVRAGLELVELRGTYVIRPMPAGIRPPSWAAREAMTAAGMASEEDIARWADAFDRVDAAATRPTLFAPMFVAARAPSRVSPQRARGPVTSTSASRCRPGRARTSAPGSGRPRR
jgi:hypothetical protein